MYNFNSGFVAVYTVSVVEIPKIVELLISADEKYVGGSSFAITSEPADPTFRAMYLSQASMDRLTASGLVM